MLSIKDHVVISKYVYEFFKLNVNLKNNFKRSLFFDKKKTFKMFFDGSLISVNYINIYFLLSLVKSARIFTARSTNKLENYVTFTRVNFHIVIKSWCDWCSIANGYAAFLIDAINECSQNNDLDHIKNYNQHLIKLKLLLLMLLKYLTLVAKEDVNLLKKSVFIKNTALFPVYDHAPLHIRKVLDLITNMYNTFQELEHVWCPFQHMQRIAFLAHSDKERYNSYLQCESFDDVIKAGEILFNFKHVKCQECNIILNERLGAAASPQKQTKTEDFFQLMCQLSS